MAAEVHNRRTMGRCIHCRSMHRTRTSLWRRRTHTHARTYTHRAMTTQAATTTSSQSALGIYTNGPRASPNAACTRTPSRADLLPPDQHSDQLLALGCSTPEASIQVMKYTLLLAESQCPYVLGSPWPCTLAVLVRDGTHIHSLPPPLHGRFDYHVTMAKSATHSIRRRWACLAEVDP